MPELPSGQHRIEQSSATLDGLIDAADSPSASECDLRALRAELRTTVETGAGDQLRRGTIKAAVECINETPAVRAFIEADARALRQRLAAEGDSPTEMLLIDQIVVSHIRLNYIEQQYSAQCEGEGHAPREEFWDRRLAAAQRRLLRAVETLARVRSLLPRPSVQVNIAATGGKQIVSN